MRVPSTKKADPRVRQRPASQIDDDAEAAEIPERSLIIAADALGVRTRHGQWWLSAHNA